MTSGIDLETPGAQSSFTLIRSDQYFPPRPGTRPLQRRFRREWSQTFSKAAGRPPPRRRRVCAAPEGTDCVAIETTLWPYHSFADRYRHRFLAICRTQLASNTVKMKLRSPDRDSQFQRNIFGRQSVSSQ
jgi:hypothetical protein